MAHRDLTANEREVLDGTVVEGSDGWWENVCACWNAAEAEARLDDKVAKYRAAVAARKAAEGAAYKTRAEQERVLWAASHPAPR